ncbi:MAG: cyclic nucleotide-binding domain-containing protein [Acidobacteriota bacterium]
MSGSEVISKTSLRRIEQYRDRWSSYGQHTGIAAISDKPSPAELREHELFRDFDDAFLEKISPDVSIAVWRKDCVLFEQGTYLDLAFFIADGEVEVYLEGVEGFELTASPIFDESRTQMTRLPGPEAPGGDDGGGTRESTAVGTRASAALPRFDPDDADAREITFLASVDHPLPKGKGTVLGKGELLGEIGAMSGWPQSVTARTVGQCRLVQIRVAALRLMKRRSRSLKERLDRLYRRRALTAQLRSTPLFQNLGTLQLEALKESVELVSLDPGEVAVREGDPVDALYLVRSGFLRVDQRLGDGDLVVTYLSKGMTLGELEVMVEGVGRWETTATSVEFAELVKVPLEVLKGTLAAAPEMEEMLWNGAVARLQEIGQSRRDVSRSELTRTALDTGLVQGHSILLLDLSLCTRCDDCVRGCADTHGGRPRFVREGQKIDNLLVPRSCYHCRDPVCLVGCPTGAIHRAGTRGSDVAAVVDIDDGLCIGCGTCANNCPYDAIVMHDTGDQWPDDMVPTALRGEARRVASKCDLCHSTGHDPACVSNCPQGCAFRVGSVDEIRELLDGQG